MSTWLSAHNQACMRALRRLVAQPASSILSILVIGIAITLPLGLYLLFTNVATAASKVNAEPNVNVYMALDASDADARELDKRLRSTANVSSVRFVPREAALAEMKRVPSLNELMSSLEGNPLPHAFTIRPASVDAAVLASLRSVLSNMPKVERVVLEFEWAQKLRRFATFAERLVFLIGCVLSLAVVFVTGNTIRLQILTNREEIEVSRLIGATRGFVRRPFLYFGAIQGFLAGAVALGTVAVLIKWAGDEIKALSVSYASDFALQLPQPAAMVWVVCLAAFLGWLGALFSVGMYLHRAR